MINAVSLLLALGLIGFAYAGYPLVCWVRARLKPRPMRTAPVRPSVSILIAAWREASTIEEKLQSLAAQTYPLELCEVIVVCDGSDDGTDVVAYTAGQALRLPVRVFRLCSHRGKAAALNAAGAAARGEVLVFTDARQRLSPRAIEMLVRNFADPEVGLVGGEVVQCNPGAAGAYSWYEASIRRLEARSGSMVGISGALYAVRRELFAPLPEETILDDLLVLMRVRLKGRRAGLEPAAQAFDSSASFEREFNRKARTQSGHWQLLLLEPALLLPWRNPSFFDFVCHRLLRLLVPYALVVVLVASARLPSPWAGLFVGTQLLAYALAIWGYFGARRAFSLARLCAIVVVLNAAAVLGMWRFLRHGRRLQW